MRQWFLKNLANLITAAGFIFACGIGYYGLFTHGHIAEIFILNVLTLASDGLDGYIARSRKIESQFGADIDVLRDKIYIIAVFIVLIRQYWPILDISHFWITIIAGLVAVALLLEITLVVIGLIIRIKRLSIETNLWGKFKMALLGTIAVVWFLLMIVNGYISPRYYQRSILLLVIFLTGAVVFAGISIRDYLKKYRINLKQTCERR